MATEHDPFEADKTAPLTVDGEVYQVVAFNDSGAAPIETDLQGSDGAYVGGRTVLGKRTASITIEVHESATTTIEQLIEITYRGTTWVVLQVGRSASSTGPGQMTLSLREKTAAEVAAGA